MANENETVEEVYADVIYKIGFIKDGESEKTSLSAVANRFHEAHKRELAAKDQFIKELAEVLESPEEYYSKKYEEVIAKAREVIK